MFWIILLLLIAGVLIFWFSPGQKQKREKTNLEKAIQRKLRMNEEQTQDYIKDMQDRLGKRYPGKSETWYLEKILSDLERGR